MVSHFANSPQQAPVFVKTICWRVGAKKQQSGTPKSGVVVQVVSTRQCSGVGRRTLECSQALVCQHDLVGTKGKKWCRLYQRGGVPVPAGARSSACTSSVLPPPAAPPRTPLPPGLPPPRYIFVVDRPRAAELDAAYLCGAHLGHGVSVARFRCAAPTLGSVTCRHAPLQC